MRRASRRAVAALGVCLLWGPTAWGLTACSLLPGHSASEAPNDTDRARVAAIAAADPLLGGWTTSPGDDAVGSANLAFHRPTLTGTSTLLGALEPTSRTSTEASARAAADAATAQAAFSTWVGRLRGEGWTVSYTSCAAPVGSSIKGSYAVQASRRFDAAGSNVGVLLDASAAADRSYTGAVAQPVVLQARAVLPYHPEQPTVLTDSLPAPLASSCADSPTVPAAPVTQGARAPGDPLGPPR